MSAQSRSCRWIRLWSILLLLGAMLFAPAFAGGEDDPAVGGSKSESEETAGTVDPTEGGSPSDPNDPNAPDEPQSLTDWLLWWLTLGLLF